MPQKRTVLVESISYRGTDGEDHVGVRGEEITVADEGVAHFDWVQDATPEGREARYRAEADKPARKAPAKAVEKD